MSAEIFLSVELFLGTFPHEFKRAAYTLKDREDRVHPSHHPPIRATIRNVPYR